MPTTKRRVNAKQKRMVCNCGAKKIVRFVGGGKGGGKQAAGAAAAKKIAKMPGAKKVAPKKVQAKKKGGTPCKCNNPFAKK